MVGIADFFAECGAHGCHCPQMDVLIRGGVFRIAVQEGDFSGAVVLQDGNCLADFVHGTHSGGHDDILMRLGDGYKVGVVGDFAGWDFKKWNANAV